MPKNLAERALLACGVTLATAAFALALAAAVTPRAANALPIYAQRTGLPCGQCHVNPAGGGPRNAFGRAFARNGHRLPGSKTGSSPNRSRRYRPSGSSRSPGYGGGGYGMGPGMMGGYGGGMMGGYGR